MLSYVDVFGKKLISTNSIHSFDELYFIVKSFDETHSTNLIEYLMLIRRIYKYETDTLFSASDEINTDILKEFMFEKMTDVVRKETYENE